MNETIFEGEIRDNSPLSQDLFSGLIERMGGKIVGTYDSMGPTHYDPVCVYHVGDVTIEHIQRTYGMRILTAKITACGKKELVDKIVETLQQNLEPERKK